MAFHPCSRQNFIESVSVFALQLANHIELLDNGGGFGSKSLVVAIILIFLSQITSVLVCDQSMVILNLFCKEDYYV